MCETKDTKSAMLKGARLRCPQCGEGKLFDSYLKVTASCDACGLDLTPQRADDGPAYIVILLVCHIVGFGDSSVDYILRFWISDPTGGLTNIRGNVYLALWDAFKANGISIPFPQREVRVVNETLPPMADRPSPPGDGT